MRVAGAVGWAGCRGLAQPGRDDGPKAYHGLPTTDHGTCYKLCSRGTWLLQAETWHPENGEIQHGHHMSDVRLHRFRH